MMYRTLATPDVPFWTETDALVIVPWHEAERVLGHPYDPGPEDDDALFAALAKTGRFPWLRTTPGRFDEELGWVLEKPQKRNRRR